MNLPSLSSDQLVAIAFFIVGSIVVTVINTNYANVFKRSVDKDSGKGSEQLSTTFVSGHLLAFFVLPFAMIIASSLGLLGKLDSGVSAILGMIVSYIIQKVTIR